VDPVKKKNPVIEKARGEGYNEGFKNGFEHGKYTACVVFADKMEGLEHVNGIGPKIMDKIVKHFGQEYFEERDNNEQAERSKG
jgi:ERCC4-type nuclease